MKRQLFFCLLLLLGIGTVASTGGNQDMKKMSTAGFAIQRMGHTTTELFDANWLFARYGLQEIGRAHV